MTVFWIIIITQKLHTDCLITNVTPSSHNLKLSVAYLYSLSVRVQRWERPESSQAHLLSRCLEEDDGSAPEITLTQNIYARAPLVSFHGFSYKASFQMKSYARSVGKTAEEKMYQVEYFFSSQFPWRCAFIILSKFIVFIQ